MAGANSSTSDLYIPHQQLFKIEFDAVTCIKLSVVLLMSLFFIYVNCVMLFALGSKPIFHETPRYILFAHMLMNDSILLLITAIMYAMGLSMLIVTKAICTFLVVISHCTFRNAPLTLAAMSLERYVAICFPLHHSTFATPKRTGIALMIIWILSSINIITDIIFAFIVNPNHVTEMTFCTQEKLFITKWQVDKHMGFDILYFVSVAIIIIVTYISIMVTARSVSSDKNSANKALRTVLLHLIQLGLCLTSFIYVTIESAMYMMTGSNPALFINLRYLNFLIILILPRCLSPLIYGLRDDAVRPLFRYFFCCRSGQIRPSVNVH